MQFGFFEQPVFDVERLLLGQAHIGVDGVGIAHHVDSVDVELTGNARRGLVLGNRHHADAGQQNDHRVGIAQGRAVGALAAVVVGGVVGAVRHQFFFQRGGQGGTFELVDGGFQDQRADLGAQEVVGARCAHGRQRGELHAVHKFHHRRLAIHMHQLVAALGGQAAQHGQHTGQGGVLFGGGQRLLRRATKGHGLAGCGLAG